MPLSAPIRVSAEPIDERRCKFVLSERVHEPGVATYASMAEAAESPIARAVLGVPAVCEVIVSGNVLTAVQDGSMPWSALEPQVRYAVQTAWTPPAAPADVAAPTGDDEVYDLVDEIFREQVNPAVAQHGGKVELLDVQDGTVVVRMMGGCQGCGMANVTLRQGIEAALKRAIPAVKGIQDITDHASGTNPYFTAGTK